MVNNSIREALEKMAWQFAYRGVIEGKSVLHTGGLSALIDTFEALGWENPHFVEDIDGLICDVEGCTEFQGNQGYCWRETGCWMVCLIHSGLCVNGGKQPKMKQRAIDREAMRTFGKHCCDNMGDLCSK